MDRNVLYPPTEFHDAIKHFFKTVHVKHNAELKKLLTLNFQHYNDLKYTKINRLKYSISL